VPSDGSPGTQKPWKPQAGCRSPLLRATSIEITLLSRWLARPTISPALALYLSVNLTRAPREIPADPADGLPARQSSRAIRWLRTSIAASLLVPVAILALAAWHTRQATLAEAEGNARRSVATLAEHALKVFETHGLMLDQVDERVRGLSCEAMRRAADLQDYLARSVRHAPQIETVWVLDEQGFICAASEPRRTDGNSRADRDYFIGAKSSDRIFVGRALIGRIGAVPFFSVARRRSSPDGGFAGIILASIEIKYFADYYRSIASPQQHRIALYRADGALLALTPGGTAAFDEAQQRRLAERFAVPEGVQRGPAVSDGVARIRAWKVLPDWGIAVAYALDEADVLRAWRETVSIYGLVAALASLALIGVTASALRWVRWERNAAAANIALRRKAEEALRQAHKMEAVGQMTGGVAHDFNNLLMVVIGNLEMLADQADRPEIVRKFAASALKAARRGGILTKQLLAFGRRQMLRPETVTPNRLIETIIPLIRQAAGETVELRTILTPGIRACRIDPGQFEAALLDLVVNAREAMRGGGRMTIETRNVEIAAGETRGDPEFEAGSYVLVSVADTGSGMSPEVRERAFEPFFTTKEIGAGSGLGLSQVYGFVKQSGGHVRIESELGAGTTVELYFPRASISPAASGARAESVPQDGRTILLTEDTAEVLELVAGMVRGLGYDVVTAKSAFEALAVLRGGQRIDALFSDVVMPGMRGDQLAREARLLRPQLKVLLTTGHAEHLVGGDDANKDQFPVILKPYGGEELAEKLSKLLSAA
jgi:two-component system NtrC family sensor kinase